MHAVELPLFERWRRALRALAIAASDPNQTDQVLVFSHYANLRTAPARVRRFLESPDGARLFAERRRIDSTTVDFDRLLALPAGTLGHAHARFMRSHGLTPDIFESAPSDVTDPRAAFVILRFRQTHDLWHVVTGYETDPAGEIALQAFTFTQTGAPSTLILALLGMAKGVFIRPSIVREVFTAFRRGARAGSLATFPWEDHWSTPLDEVRELLRIHDA